MTHNLDKGANSGIWKEKRRKNITKGKDLRLSRKEAEMSTE